MFDFDDDYRQANCTVLQKRPISRTNNIYDTCKINSISIRVALKSFLKILEENRWSLVRKVDGPKVDSYPKISWIFSEWSVGMRVDDPRNRRSRETERLFGGKRTVPNSGRSFEPR